MSPELESQRCAVRLSFEKQLPTSLVAMWRKFLLKYDSKQFAERV